MTLRIQGGVLNSKFVYTSGGESLFINLRVAGEAGVFGVDPMSLELTDDNGSSLSFM